MSEEKTDIEKLIRLKRFEQPPEGYFDDFLLEFQSRQRSELLKRSAHSLFFERLGTYFSGFSKRQWVYAGSAAYAAVTIGFFLIAGSGGQEAGNSPVPGVSGATANIVVPAAEEKHMLWDKPAIMLVEDDHIANRQHSMTSEPEWNVPDIAILPTSAQGEDILFRPTQDKDTEKDESVTAPSVPPIGTAL